MTKLTALLLPLVLGIAAAGAQATALRLTPASSALTIGAVFNVGIVADTRVEFARIIKADYDRWGGVIRSTGFDSSSFFRANFSLSAPAVLSKSRIFVSAR